MAAPQPAAAPSDGTSQAFAVFERDAPFKPWKFDLHPLDPDYVELRITHSGVCHSDLHTINGDWGNQPWPVVPGHEIVGIVTQVGSNVKNLKVGQRAGVGPQATSCLKCRHCTAGRETVCEEGFLGTYAAKLPDGYVTKGGYSVYHRTHSHFVVPLPDGLPSDAAAPLLCAGVTVYAPMKRFKVGKGTRLGVVGLGGLGHLAIKYGHALGAHVTGITSTPSKAEEIKSYGAERVLISTAPDFFEQGRHQFDLILLTSSGPIDFDMYCELLASYGTLVVLGLPPGDIKFDPFTIVKRDLSITGSIIGTPQEIAEVFEIAAKHNTLPVIETYPLDKVNDVYVKLRANTIKYRAVLIV